MYDIGKFLFMMQYTGSKFIKQMNREIEIITDDDLTEDIKRDGIIIEIE